ncbi:MAG: CoA pyrophosphatase [Chloroflexi bacterium]|nr:CoA pyrophosphatase [Chloroflexota bacterium]
MSHRFAPRFDGYNPQELTIGALKPAAVLLLLVGDARAERIIFQLRTQNVRFHKGEISLPGGRLDATDPSFLHAALREAHEEIGVSPGSVQVLGALDDVEASRSQHLIRPFVGVLHGDDRPRVTAPREVAMLLDVPLAHLQSDAARIWHTADRDGVIEATPAYRFGEHTIWGVTARIVDSFLELIEGTDR